MFVRKKWSDVILFVSQCGAERQEGGSARVLLLFLLLYDGFGLVSRAAIIVRVGTREMLGFRATSQAPPPPQHRHEVSLLWDEVLLWTRLRAGGLLILQSHFC